MAAKHPPILWAQRSSLLYLAIEVQDMKIEELKVHEDHFGIKGTKGDEKYEADLQLYAKLKGEDCRQVATDRRIELVVSKETAEWWPHLLKEKTKLSWVKVDFDKWKDEDDENEEADGFGGGFGDMDFSQFGAGDPSKFEDMDDFDPETEGEEDASDMKEIDKPGEESTVEDVDTEQVKVTSKES